MLQDTRGYSRVPQGAHKMKKTEDMTGAVNKPGLRHECVMPELVSSANCDQAKRSARSRCAVGDAGCEWSVREYATARWDYRTYCAFCGSCGLRVHLRSSTALQA